MNILVIYGSLREKSLNKALAHAAPKFAPEGMSVEVMGIEGFLSAMALLALPFVILAVLIRVLTTKRLSGASRWGVS